MAVTSLLAFVMLPAAPASAHGGGGSDASNFASVVEGVVRLDDGGDPAGRLADLPAVTWRVLANDALLEVSNRGHAELVVPGYQGEPYLRVAPGGVWENRNSPAAYLNDDRYATTPVPAGVGPEAAPDWVRVGDEPLWRWHDHRIHWMAPTPPPAVTSNPDEVTVVQDWLVPFRLAGRRLAVDGQTRWAPPGPVLPW
ncbi:MAG: hypothetical protein M3387_09700, partial [Actinomycetota bacterium]|nr:hypothetical protein [Actinomycetota bacterium]